MNPYRCRTKPLYYIVMTYRYQLTTPVKTATRLPLKFFASHPGRTSLKLSAGNFFVTKYRLLPCQLVTIVGTTSLNNARNSHRHTRTPIGVSDLGYTGSASIPTIAPSQSSWRTGFHYSSWICRVPGQGVTLIEIAKNCK